MALSTIVVKIQGDASGLAVALKTAGVEVTTFQGKVQGVDRAATSMARGLSNLGRGFTNAAGQSGVLNSEISILASSVGNVGLASAAAGIGLGALVGGLAASIAASINFEAAITKVAKTANFTTEQTKEFGDEILNMSRKLPVATSALTDIAVVAGQLGISGTANIASFVEEIAKLQSTTGVDAGTLATSLGTILQVANEPTSRLKNISAALTELGNTSNSTESQILDFSTRLVGLTSALGVTTEDLLGLSSAFAAAGVDAERGATAIQRIFVAIDTATQAGGTDLALIAQVAGLTVEQFKRLQETNPAQAFAAFVEGLKGVKNVVPVLAELGIADQRLISAVQSVANSSQSLTASLRTSERAAAAATATDKEAGRSFETTAAKIQLLKNNIQATAIEFGNLFNPAVAAGLDQINGLFSTGADDIQRYKQGITDLIIALGELNASLNSLPLNGLFSEEVTKTIKVVFSPLGIEKVLTKTFGVDLSPASDFVTKTIKVAFTPFGVEHVLAGLVGGEPEGPALGAATGSTRVRPSGQGTGLDPIVETAKKAIPIFKDLKTAISDALKEFDQVDPITEALKVQLSVAESQRDAIQAIGGDTSALDDRIRGLNNALQQQQEISAGLNSVISLYVNYLSQATDNTTGLQVGTEQAGIKASKLVDFINGLPPEQKTDILLNLPLDDMNQMLKFLNALDASHDVKISLSVLNKDVVDQAISGINARAGFGPFTPEESAALASAFTPQVPEAQSKLGLGTGGIPSTGGIGAGGADKAKELSDDAKALLALSAAFADFHEKTGGSIEDFRAVSRYFADAAAQTQKLSDAVVDYKVATIEAADATVENMNVLIKVTEDRTDLEKRQADVTVRLRAAAIEAADATFTLRQGLVAIAEHLLETGQTIAQFILETSTSALEGFKSAFDAIFNRPTRETAQLNLQKDELERKRLLLIREGRVPSGEHEDPMIKALDNQIDAINQEIALRQKDIDIMKDHATLADQTLNTDRDQAQQAALLTTAIKDQSEVVKNQTGIVFLQTLAAIGFKNALLEATTTLRGAIPGRASGGPASGLTLVGEQGPELVSLPSGSQVFSNAQSRAIGEGGNNTFNVISYITADSAASAETMGQIADMIDQRVAGRLRLSGFASGAVNQNTFTPGGQR